MAITGGQVGFTGYQQPDYSGVVAASGLPLATLSKSISDFSDYKKEQKKVDADNKASAKAIEAAITLGKSYQVSGVEKTLRPFLEAYNDPNLSPIEKAALLDEGKGMIPNVFGRFDASEADAIKREQIDAAQNEAKARAAAARKEAPNLAEFGVEGGKQTLQWNPDTQSFERPKVNMGESSLPQQSVDLTDLVKGFEGFNPNAYNDYNQTSIGFGTKGKLGETITEEEASNRLQAELTGHAERIQKAAELKGISLNKNQFNALTSFDYNTGKGADLIERFGENPNQLASKILEYTKAGGKDLTGLVRRRGIEAALFLAPEQQLTTQNQGRIGFTPAKTEEPNTTSRIVTGQEAVGLGGDPNKKYIIKEVGKDVTDMAVVPPDITPAEERARKEDEDKKAITKRAGELTVKSINKFIDEKGNYNEALDKAVGYGEEFATGVAKALPFLGTQSPQDRANQKELAILVEKGLLDAASELKPVSNVDLQLLRENRPKITDPKELWASWLKDVRDILGDPNSYKEAGSKVNPAAPLTIEDELNSMILEENK